MIRVNEVEVFIDGQGAVHLDSQGATLSRTLTKTGKLISLNHSIGVLLSSYTRAINKQENYSGSLFRQSTKAECLSQVHDISSFFFLSTVAEINIYQEKDYPLNCFNYIHQNPVKANLVSEETDWEFSSARDYAGGRIDSFVNKGVIRDFQA